MIAKAVRREVSLQRAKGSRVAGGIWEICIRCVLIGSHYPSMSRITRSAALWPAAPITEPAGWHPALQEYTPSIGVAYGRRSAKPNELSTWWMWPRVMPKWRSIFGGVSGKVSGTSAEVAGGKGWQDPCH